MKAIYQNLLGGKSGALSLALLALLILVILPLSLDIFRLNLIGKYLTYAFVEWAWCYSGVTVAFSVSVKACSSVWAAT